MTNEDHQGSPVISRRSSAFALVAILLLVALLAAVRLSVGDDAGGTAPTVAPSFSEVPSTSATVDTRSEVVERLRRILEIRDHAFRDRTAEVLNDIYTDDCPCLEGDKNAIQELIDNNYHVVGGVTSIRIREVNKAGERLWLIVADFQSAPLRIETEDNILIREEPAGSDLFQFALSKPAESSEWLLGRASVYRNGSG